MRYKLGLIIGIIVASIMFILLIRKVLMELKSSVIMEVKRNDFTFNLELPVGAPLGDAYEAVLEMLSKIVEMAKESVEKNRPVKDKNE